MNMILFFLFLCNVALWQDETLQWNGVCVYVCVWLMMLAAATARTQRRRARNNPLLHISVPGRKRRRQSACRLPIFDRSTSGRPPPVFRKVVLSGCTGHTSGVPTATPTRCSVPKNEPSCNGAFELHDKRKQWSVLLGGRIRSVPRRSRCPTVCQSVV